MSDEDWAKALVKQIGADAEEQFNVYWTAYGRNEAEIRTWEVSGDIQLSPDAYLELVRRAFVAGWQGCIIKLLRKGVGD